MGNGTLLGGIDGSIRRLEFTYDTDGRPEKFTSKNSAGSVVNEVQRAYNGLGQLTAEYQEHSGAVNTATSLKTQYMYSFAAGSGGANHSRRTQMVRILHYEYNSGVDNDISRISYLADDNGSGGVGTHLEEYSYLGQDTLVRLYRPEANAELTYISKARRPTVKRAISTPASTASTGSLTRGGSRRAPEPRSTGTNTATTRPGT